MDCAFEGRLGLIFEGERMHLMVVGGAWEKVWFGKVRCPFVQKVGMFWTVEMALKMTVEELTVITRVRGDLCLLLAHGLCLAWTIRIEAWLVVAHPTVTRWLTGPSPQNT
ncbi:protein FRG2-like-1 [Sesbania bispinosa]|nr:protein FRG2-like-1 [Sesbania bispinosa]